MNQKCVVCHSEKIAPFKQISRENIEIELFECKDCGHVHQNIHTFEDIYTSGEFSKIARNNSYLPDKDKINKLDKKAFERFEFYKSFLKNNDNFLEIGSSIGSFIYLLKMFGKKAEGLEPDPNYAAFSMQQYGFEQFSSTLENFDSSKKFHSALSFHVIEHVKNPLIFVEKLSKILEIGAEILFECPSYEIHNFGNIQKTIWKPHIHYFTASSLYTLFSNFFKVTEIQYNGESIYIKATHVEKSTYLPYIFDNYKKISSKIFKYTEKLPEITKKIPVKQFLLQSLFQKHKFIQIFEKGVRYSAYKIDEYHFLMKEKGLKLKKSKKGFHITNFKGWGNNAGDIVLSKCVRDILRKKLPLQFNIKAVSEKVDKQTIEQINLSDFLVIGGGGLLLPDTNPNTVSGWQWAINQELLNEIKVPIIVYAIGYNYFRGQEPNEFFVQNLNLLLEKSDFFSLRNFGSIEKVNELTNKRFQDKIVYQPCPTTLIRKFAKNIPAKIRTKNIAVNIAFDRPLLRFGKDYETILTSIAKAIKDLEVKGYRIYNYTHITADRKFELLLDRFNVNYRTVELQYLFPQEIYNLYNTMELVIGMRGHAQMIPYGLNTKILTLGTHDKMRWFMQDVDLMDCYIELHEEHSNLRETIYSKAIDILEKNSTFVEQKLIASQEELYKVSKQNLDKIFHLIK